jgi:hypothetical protein
MNISPPILVFCALNPFNRRFVGGFYTLRACLKIARGAAVRDFGWGQGGEVGASPTRPVTAEPTLAPGKRPGARRVFAEKAVCLRCSSVTDRCGYAPVVAPRHPVFSAKTAPLGIFRKALSLFKDFSILSV